MGNIKKRFEECPYGCNNNGMLLDANLGKMIPCPYCSKLKETLIKNGEMPTDEEQESQAIEDVLGIKNNRFLSDRFVYDSIIPKGEQLLLNSRSIENQKKEAEELYLGLTVGTLPDHSICFGLSRVGDVEKFVYPMLVKAYKSGLSIGKFYSAREIEEGLAKDEYDPEKIHLKNLTSVDLLMVLYSADGGIKTPCSYTLQGIMQNRSLKSKPTVIVTTQKVSDCSQFLGYWDNPSYALATPVFLKYNDKAENAYTTYDCRLQGYDESESTENNIKVKGSNTSIVHRSSSSTSMADLLNM